MGTTCIIFINIDLYQALFRIPKHTYNTSGYPISTTLFLFIIETHALWETCLAIVMACWLLIGCIHVCATSGFMSCDLNLWHLTCVHVQGNNWFYCVGNQGFGDVPKFKSLHWLCLLKTSIFGKMPHYMGNTNNKDRPDQTQKLFVWSCDLTSQGNLNK